MSCLFMEGFHVYSSVAQLFDANHGGRWTEGPGGATAFEPTGGEEGQPAVQVVWTGSPNGSNWIEFDIANTTHVVFGGRWKFQALPSVQLEVVQFIDSGVIVHATIAVEAAGNILVNLSSSTEKATSADNVVIPTVWQDFEFKLNLTNTGSASCVIDGVKVIDATGIDLEQGAPGCSTIHLENEFSNPDDIRFTDLYCLAVDATPPNDHLKQNGETVRVLKLNPSADVAVDFASIGGGTNFSEVDESGGHDFDGTFNQSQIVGDKDVMGLETAGIVGAVHAVQTNYAARTNDGGAKNMKGFQRQGATQEDGTTQAIAVGFDIETDIFDDDADGNAWNKARLNSSTFGYEIV